MKINRKDSKDERPKTTVDPAVGLKPSEVEERISLGLINAANVKVQKSYLKIVLQNTFTFFSVILYFVALLFLGFRLYLVSIGHEDLASAYFGISKYFYLGPLICSIIIGTIQECRSKRILDKLRIVSDSKYTVIRDGKETLVTSSQIVLDDIIKVKAGEQISADMRILDGALEVNESLLTGEADDVKKDQSEGKNQLLSGSSVVSGSCLAIVTAVGKETYANRLQQKVKNIVKSKSELMRNIYGIINVMSVFIFVIVLVVVGTMAYKINKWGGDSSVFISQATKDFLKANYGQVVPSSIGLNDLYAWSIIITTASAFAIGVLPMGLVLLTSVTLAVSVVSLAKKQTLIQELYSLENLSRIDTICLDKTGTLTDGSMAVTQVIFASKAIEEQKEAFFKRMGSFLSALPSYNATATALTIYFPPNKDFQVKQVIPFSSTRKMSEVIFQDGEDVCLGAPEYLLGEEDQTYREQANQIAAQGLRVLVVTLNRKAALLIALKDNIRASAPSTIDFFNQNGVDVKIISGDNPFTVSKIAEECHVKGSSKTISLEGVSVEKLDELADQYVVFGRVSPEQKEALVIALQKANRKVAMTGDGVNDILALRKANSSISFANATDAAKSCSDVVLMDNDFSHLKDVVAQGRRVVNNIQRTAILFLMKTICISLLAFLLIPFKKGQSQFTIENIYLVQTGVIAVGGFLLSVESCPSPIKGNFKSNVYPQAMASGLLMALGALIPCILNSIIVNGHPLVSFDNCRSLISLLTNFAGFAVLLRMCLPLNRYRGIVFSVSAFINAFLALAMPVVYVGGRSWSLKDIVKNGHNSDIARNFFNFSCPVFTNLGTTEWITIGCFVAFALPLYVLTMKFIQKTVGEKFFSRPTIKK